MEKKISRRYKNEAFFRECIVICYKSNLFLTNNFFTATKVFKILSKYYRLKFKFNYQL